MADAAVDATDRDPHGRPRVKPDSVTRAKPAFDGADIAALSQRYSPAQVRRQSKHVRVLRGNGQPLSCPAKQTHWRMTGDRTAGLLTAVHSLCIPPPVSSVLLIQDTADQIMTAVRSSH